MATTSHNPPPRFKRDDRVRLIDHPQWVYRVNFHRPDGTVSVYDRIAQGSHDVPADQLERY